jgi:hypothetical protein
MISFTLYPCLQDRHCVVSKGKKRNEPTAILVEKRTNYLYMILELNFAQGRVGSEVLRSVGPARFLCRHSITSFVIESEMQLPIILG